MLERTFLHISGVGEKKERHIWKRGVRDWRGFMDRGRELLPKGLFELGRPVIERSLAALESPHGLAELAAMIPRAEHWRFWPRYKKICYLDIECGGDETEWGGLSVVGVYDGAKVRQFISGRDLDELNHALMDFDIVCTFAGNSFDLPLLKQVMPQMHIPPVQIDLRWLMKRIGYSGGLKRIERELKIGRPAGVQDMDGYGAVALWRAHQAGEPGALDKLLTYNACDVMNLEPLLKLGAKTLGGRMLDRAGLSG